MSALSPEDMEARLHAQRELLVALVAIVAASVPEAERFWTTLEQALPLQNHQEDPGVVASGAYAIAGATALEYAALLEGARSRFEAARGLVRRPAPA